MSKTIDIIRLLKPARRLRITRRIVYEGPVDWLISTFAQSAIAGAGYNANPPREGGTILCTEEEIEDLDYEQSEETLINDLPVQYDGVVQSFELREED